MLFLTAAIVTNSAILIERDKGDVQPLLIYSADMHSTALFPNATRPPTVQQYGSDINLTPPHFQWQLRKSIFTSNPWLRTPLISNALCVSVKRSECFTTAEIAQRLLNSAFFIHIKTGLIVNIYKAAPFRNNYFFKKCSLAYLMFLPDGYMAQNSPIQL